MAVRFDASGDYLARTANLPTSTAFTVCGWFMRRGTGDGTWETVFGLDNGAAYCLTYCRFDATAGIKGWTNDSGGAGSTVIAVSNDVPYFVAMVGNGSGATGLTVYARAGASAALSSQSYDNASFTPSAFRVSQNAAFGEWANSRMWNVKCWDRALTAAELLVESQYRRVMYPASLNFHWVMDRHDQVFDQSGNGRNPTVGGTLATEDSGFGLWRSRRRVFIPPVAAGGGGDTELVVADAAHGHTADNLSLIEQEVIAVADALHGHSADTIGLLQQNVLVVADALHDHAADNIVLNLTTPLVVADATHVHTADSLGLIQQNVLAVADAAHGHTAESVTLDTGVVLQVADAIHAHGVDNVALTQAAVLAIADALHAHAADNIVLSQQYSLSVADATHGHTVDNVTLSLSDLLTVADSFHAHTAETIALTQASVLVVSDALHAHLADMLSLQLPGFVPPRGRVLIVQGKNTTFVVTRGNRTFNA